MFIEVHDDGALALRESDNFKEFKVICTADRMHFIDSAVLGRVDYPHIWVEPSWVLEAYGASNPEWRRSWAAMIDFARARGWVDDHGRIRAHITC